MEEGRELRVDYKIYAKYVCTAFAAPHPFNTSLDRPY